jgi:hypothetical protein
MSPGAGLTLIAIGAILTFAVQVNFSGLNIDAVGVILMLTGLVGMSLTFILRRRRVAAAAEAEEAWDTPTERTYTAANHDQGYPDQDGGY